jgi:xylulokinase
MKLYLGLDSSTQGLKAIIIDPGNGEIAFTEQVNYSRDLMEYKCPDGAMVNPDPLIKHALPMMWVAALDLLLEKMQQNGVPLEDICAISGSGQQHGSVYLNDQFVDVLQSLNPAESLATQLEATLARPSSPIWMDSSTSLECNELTEQFGKRVQLDTGSPAIERFTGPQIRKFFKEQPDLYAATETVHLVSSFMASVLCGNSAPIDYGDGAGMNLLNLKTMQWDDEITEFTAPGLLEKLPSVVPASTIAGQLHPYFAKYGLRSGIPIVTWSGDNPCSLTGSGAAETGYAVISFGTSDTFFAVMDEAKLDPKGYGHVFGNQNGGFMGLICFTNGSLARERIKDDVGVDWKWFDNDAFELTIPGNNGNMILPYFVPETTPLTLEPKVARHGTEQFCSGNGSAAENIRAVVEAQIMNIKLHSQWLGNKFKTIRITGGASQSQGLCQTVADIFQSRVEKISIPDSAGLGSAIWSAATVSNFKISELNDKFTRASEVILPNPANAAVYAEMTEKFAAFQHETLN